MHRCTSPMVTRLDLTVCLRPHSSAPPCLCSGRSQPFVRTHPMKRLVALALIGASIDACSDSFTTQADGAKLARAPITFSRIPSHKIDGQYIVVFRNTGTYVDSRRDPSPTATADGFVTRSSRRFASSPSSSPTPQSRRIAPSRMWPTWSRTRQSPSRAPRRAPTGSSIAWISDPSHSMAPARGAATAAASRRTSSIPA
jgi:hypothetical protein